MTASLGQTYCHVKMQQSPPLPTVNAHGKAHRGSKKFQVPGGPDQNWALTAFLNARLQKYTQLGLEIALVYNNRLTVLTIF